MSIIHDALKKAAEEGVLNHTPIVIARPATPWARSVLSALLIGGLSLAAVSYVLISKYTSQPWLGSSFSKGRLGPSTAIPAQKVSPPPVKVQPSPKDSDRKVVAQQDEGKRLLALGTNLYHQGEMLPALEALTKATVLSPQSPIAHNNLGLLLRQQGKLSEALSQYQEALRLDPEYAEALNNIGLVYDQTGSVDEAANYYKKALSLKPKAAVFHLNYATLLERKGDFSQAREEYQNYLQLETDPKKDSVTALVKTRLKELRGLN